MNMGIVDRLYHSMINDIDYKDLLETEKARDKVKAYVTSRHFSKDEEEAFQQWLEMEKLISEVACANKHQRFLYGFRMAMGLFVNLKSPYGEKSRLDENIRSEYSTLAVDGIDKADLVVNLLKENLPEEKLKDAVDTLCVSLDETKYAAFEQGFIRGIAVAKGGEL